MAATGRASTGRMFPRRRPREHVVMVLVRRLDFWAATGGSCRGPEGGLSEVVDGGHWGLPKEEE